MNNHKKVKEGHFVELNCVVEFEACITDATSEGDAINKAKTLFLEALRKAGFNNYKANELNVLDTSTKRCI